MTIDTSTIGGKLAVMQAYKGGAEIEAAGRYDAEKIWKSCLGIPSWNWAQCDFRIKPREPREFFVVMEKKGPWRALETEAQAIECAASCNKEAPYEGPHYIIKVREVLE